jgi:KaiC/GvpD/RAD55 family RecA-like ATPase
MDENNLSWLKPGGLREAVEQEVKNTFKPTTGMLRVRSANQVLKEAAEQPDPINLYDCLVIQNELTILFADTGIGKTVLAVQIGIHIAKSGHRVLYIDLELSDKQFEKRYKDDFGNHYSFPEGFFRADYTPIFEMPDDVSYEQHFLNSLIGSIDDCNAQVVIIDNMTKLASGDTDNAKNTIPVMEGLSRLKRDRGITFIALEHNKKVDSSRPISLNDLQGSKFKSNFADAVFTIGRSHSDNKLRYVKQLKVRSAEHIYDSENVATFELCMEGGALTFTKIGYANEYSFLKLDTDTVKKDRKQRAAEMKSEGRTNVEIARELGVSEGAVRKWFPKTEES